MDKNMVYKYLLSLKCEDVREKKIVDALKGKRNIKNYLMEVIEFYESKEKEYKKEGERDTQDFKKSLEEIGEKVEKLMVKFEEIEVLLSRL